jgi:hypothetical protein
MGDHKRCANTSSNGCSFYLPSSLTAALSANANEDDVVDLLERQKQKATPPSLHQDPIIDYSFSSSKDCEAADEPPKVLDLKMERLLSQNLYLQMQLERQTSQLQWYKRMNQKKEQLISHLEAIIRWLCPEIHSEVHSELHSELPTSPTIDSPMLPRPHFRPNLNVQ